MSYSTLFKIHARDFNSEAEVETRLLAPLFRDLGYTSTFVVPKKQLSPLLVSSGSRKSTIEADFLLLRKNKTAKVVVETKDPKKSVQEAWGQAASYALSYNQDKDDDSKIKWLLISNGHITSLFKHDSSNPIITLQLSDFASGSPPFVSLRSYIKFTSVDEMPAGGIPFETIPLHKLNALFDKSHNLVWRREKLAPTDAFFEFCKFIFLKIGEDKKRENAQTPLQPYQLPMTLQWIKAQTATSNHPVRDILFLQLRTFLENEINRGKKRIFDPAETLKLSATTTRELIEMFQSINLASIDEDLNGRMFEVFLNAAIRGKELGQYFTPRPLVDFMTRIGLHGKEDVTNPPKVIDASCGTAGFLIEVMAYLVSKLRPDSRFNQKDIGELASKIKNESLFGIEANERVSRIARINMYLHGDGGSHIFHGDGLDNSPLIADDMSEERKNEVRDHEDKIELSSFDLVLTNPPFSMSYNARNRDEERILRQLSIASGASSMKSNVLFLQRYFDLLKPGGEILIVLDDTVLNGATHAKTREWLLDKFVLIGVHSMPFNAFFKAKANIKTSVLHMRKKVDEADTQGYVFMSISNNIGHNNALQDTLERSNLNNILNTYFEWRRTGTLETVINPNQDPHENLECPEQIWLVPPEKLGHKRIDAFYYSPDLLKARNSIKQLAEQGNVEERLGKTFKLRKKLNRSEKVQLREAGDTFKYIEIGDVTRYGLITKYVTGKFNELPTRGEYQIRKGDILMAINNSSRGTVVMVPEEFDGAICTSGFLVIEPRSEEESHLLWYALRGELCRSQIYYLAQTASQPELKQLAWKNEFVVPLPTGNLKQQALNESRKFQSHLTALLDADQYRLS